MIDDDDDNDDEVFRTNMESKYYKTYLTKVLKKNRVLHARFFTMMKRFRSTQMTASSVIVAS